MQAALNTTPPLAADRGFREFYEREFRAVVGLAVTLTGDRWQAEDVTQEAFTRALREWEHVCTLDRPGAWVRTVAHNLAMSRFRRLQSHRRALKRLRAAPQPLVPPVDLDLEDEAFREALRALPERQRQAMALRYILDLPVRDVAAEMGVAEGTVKSLLHRGRRSVCERLGLEEARP